MHTDTAGTTVHEHHRGFTVFLEVFGGVHAHTTGENQVRVDGCRDFGNTGGFGKTQLFGYGQHVVDRYGHVVGVAASSEERHDGGAAVLYGGAFADRFDNAGYFEAVDGARAGGRRVESAALQGVGAVDSGGVNADENFVESGYGGGDFADCQSLRSTVTVLNNCSHESSSLPEAPSLVRDLQKAYRMR